MSGVFIHCGAATTRLAVAGAMVCAVMCTTGAPKFAGQILNLLNVALVTERAG